MPIAVAQRFRGLFIAFGYASSFNYYIMRVTLSLNLDLAKTLKISFHDVAPVKRYWFATGASVASPHYIRPNTISGYQKAEARHKPHLILKAAEQTNARSNAVDCRERNRTNIDTGDDDIP